MRRAGGWTPFLALARRWPPLWSQASPIQRLFVRGGTSQPGAGSCRSSTREGTAVSASKAIAICAACSPPAHSPWYPICQDPWHKASALAYGIAGAEADQGRRHRARQQDRQNGLGHNGSERALQGTRRACDVKKIAPVTRRDVKVGRRTARNAEPVDPAIGNPLVPVHHRMRAFDRDPTRGGHYGQRSWGTASTGRTHGCTDRQCDVTL